MLLGVWEGIFERSQKDFKILEKCALQRTIELMDSEIPQLPCALAWISDGASASTWDMVDFQELFVE